MSQAWHWFVVVGVVASLIGVLSLLLGNRKTSGNKTTGHSWDGIEELDNPLPMWWVGLFVGSVVFAVPFLLIYPGLGNFDGFGHWSAARQHDQAVAASEARFAPLYTELGGLNETQLHTDERARKVGRRLFINHCATCHGVNATGSFGFPNLTDSEWLWGAGLDNVKTAIRQGRVGGMPPWGVPLGEQGVSDVTQYVLSLSGQAHDGARAAAGAEGYATFCVACHGTSGKGSPLLGAPDLTNNIWLYGGSAEQIAFTIKEGRNGNMPAHATLLDEHRIQILAGYVTSLSADPGR